MDEKKTLNIVGIGSSAGSLQALEALLSNITPSNRFTYVIVQHLDPNHETKLLEILARVTTIPLNMIKNNEKPKSNRIYLCPPNYDLSIENDHFKLNPPLKKAYSAPSIDDFFISLAKNKEENAIAVILSGAGHDGTEGIKAIKAASGITIAQEPTSAKYPDMPQAAINTNLIDLILLPEDVPRYLENILKYPFTSFEDDEYRNLQNKIFNILIEKTQTDFSDYKRSTILRRIERRMILNKKNTFKEYINYLESSKEEVFLLHKELLVIVTSLFRDKSAFEQLERNLENFLLKKDKNEAIRVWVTGCATGEEAYSIAIIFYELLKKNNILNNVQIFATDISAESIEIARNGTFRKEELINVDSEIIDKYFIENNKEYKVCKNIRDLIIFSKHDIVKNPPFLNIDLITCRNLLIYFNASLQKRIFSIFFNILKNDGLLFLGKSESTNNLTNLFLSLDNKSKIFKKDVLATPPANEKIIYNKKRFASNTQPLKKELTKKSDKNALLHDSLAKTIIDKYLESYIIVNSRNHIIFTKGELNDYMKLPTGGFTQDLFSFLKDNIRIEIRTAIFKARKENIIVNLNIKLEKSKSLQIDVLPIVENNVITQNLCLIFKENNEEINIDVSDENREQFNKYSKLNIKELEQELIETKENLQSTIEELETSNEELQSTNEEFQSSNEELQSSNEELQSTNEELIIVNQKLEERTKELREAKLDLEDINDNLENIINEKTLEIKNINKSLEEKNITLTETLELFENTFEQAAVGLCQVSLDGKWIKVNNKLSEITGYKKEELIDGNFKDITHSDDLKSEMVYMEKLLKGEIKYYSINKRYYKKDKSLIWINLTCSLANKSLDDKANYLIGVIEDITLQKEYEKRLKVQKRELETIFNFTHDSIVVIDLKQKLLKFNKSFLDLTEYSKEYLLTKTYNDLTTIDDRVDNDIFVEEVKKTGYIENIERNCIFKDGKHVTINMSATLLPDKKTILLSIKDISNLKIMEQQSRLASMGEMIGNIAHQWRQPLSVITTNISGLKLRSDMTGIDKADLDECENNILKQANYLSSTIDNFRNFTKNEKIISKVKILDVLENTLSLVSASLKNNFINIILDLQDDICIEGNANELSEALINIINNSKDALKSEVKDEVDRLLFISTKQISEDSLELKILDSGGGIKNLNIQKLFEPYFTTKHQYQGTGLGLSIAHKIIVQRHHGKIDVYNKSFEYNNKTYTGACFKILFKN